MKPIVYPRSALSLIRGTASRRGYRGSFGRTPSGTTTATRRPPFPEIVYLREPVRSEERVEKGEQNEECFYLEGEVASSSCENLISVGSRCWRERTFNVFGSENFGRGGGLVITSPTLTSNFEYCHFGRRLLTSTISGRLFLGRAGKP